jgi:phosphoglycolate phosphatase-like HAD superfamily hydrolase
MEALFHRYLMYLDAELRDPRHPPYALPGVPALLQALDQEDSVILGLLTGNLRDGARAKLTAVGIDFDIFRVGAFGSDHEHRPELPAIARARTRDELGIDVHGAAMVVIGDTPADLTCGESIGARAIGVATGRYTIDALLEHDPFAVFPDLSDTDAVFRAILEA